MHLSTKVLLSIVYLLAVSAAHADATVARTEEERIALVRKVAERLDPSLLGDEPRLYADENSEGQITAYRYVYRGNNILKSVSIELDARTGTLEWIHNSSAATSKRITESHETSALLTEILDWLHWVDPAFRVDVAPYRGPNGLRVRAHRYYFGFQAQDSSAMVELAENGALNHAYFGPPLPIEKGFFLEISAESAQALARLALFQSFPEVAIFAEVWKPRLVIVYVSRYREPEVQEELYFGPIAQEIAVAGDFTRGLALEQHRLCWAVGFVVDPAFGGGSLYIDAVNGQLCERFMDLD